VKDHTRNVKRTLSKSIFLTGSENVYSTPFQEVHEIVASGYSHDQKYRLVLRETGDKDKKRFAEIWAGDILEICKDVTDIHGPFYNDGTSRLVMLVSLIFISRQISSHLSLSRTRTKLSYTSPRRS
jgi:hypothetical protein